MTPGGKSAQLSLSVALVTQSHIVHTNPWWLRTCVQGVTLAHSDSLISHFTTSIATLDGEMQGKIGRHLHDNQSSCHSSKEPIRAKLCLGLISWVLVALEVPSDITLDASIPGHYAGGA